MTVLTSKESEKAKRMAELNQLVTQAGAYSKFLSSKLNARNEQHELESEVPPKKKQKIEVRKIN